MTRICRWSKWSHSDVIDDVMAANLRLIAIGINVMVKIAEGVLDTH